MCFLSTAARFVPLTAGQSGVQERTGSKQKTAQNTVNLRTSTVKADAEDPKDRDLKYCFRIVSRDRMYLLQVRTCSSVLYHGTVIKQHHLQGVLPLCSAAI